jgi:hypothetical protein
MTILNVSKTSYNNGFSMIGAVFTLMILGIFGAALVAIISVSHESRAIHSSSNVAFYNSQAGFEYAIQKINKGENPIVYQKQFSKGTFTCGVQYVEGSIGKIMSSGYVGDYKKAYDISYPSFGADCLMVDFSSAKLEGMFNDDVTGVLLRKMCNDAVTIDKMMISWVPDGGEKVTSIKMADEIVWEDVGGLSSGSFFDVEDTTFSGSNENPTDYPIDRIHFTNTMNHKNLTIKFIMIDTSTRTVSFDLL